MMILVGGPSAGKTVHVGPSSLGSALFTKNEDGSTNEYVEAATNPVPGGTPVNFYVFKPALEEPKWPSKSST